MGGVTFEYQNGLGRTAETTEVSLMIANTPWETFTQFNETTLGPFFSLKDVEDYFLAVDEDFNDWYDVLIRQVRHFYQSGGGELFILPSEDMSSWSANEILEKTEGRLTIVFFVGILREVTATTTSAESLEIFSSLITAFETAAMPCVYILGAGAAESSAFIDCKTFSQNKVFVLGSGTRENIPGSATNSVIAFTGLVAGRACALKCSESIAWVQENDLTGIIGSDTLFQSVTNLSGNSAESFLATKGINAIGSYPNYSGKKYLKDTVTATATTNDIRNLEFARTLNEIQRTVYVGLMPYVNSPVVLNTDGTLKNDDAEQFREAAAAPLRVMRDNGKLSDFSISVSAPNILTTELVIVTVRAVPVGKSKSILVPISFTVSI